MNCRLFLLTILAVACSRRDPEPTPIDNNNLTTAENKPAAPSQTAANPDNAGDVKPVSGPISLKDATAGLTGTGPLMADIDTESGTLHCKMFDDKAPVTVANFVALSRGLQPYQDPLMKNWVKKKAYDGVTFHRAMKGFMIQGGDPTGTGGGTPGYKFADEYWPGATHDHAGLLCMANAGPNTNGMQFFITDAPTLMLDMHHSYTIFGDCEPTKVISDIAGAPAHDNGQGEVSAPDKPVKIRTISVYRK